MDDFLLRALAAGLGVALVTGPLGCFVVWRRQAYFGAALAHAALPGVALGILLDLNAAVGVAVVCLLVALLAAALEGQRRLASDTLLGIMAHGALALGLVAVALIEGMRVDLLGYLFGDILAVSWSDVAWIAAGGGLALGLLGLIWRQLLALTVHEELARAEGARVTLVSIAFMLLIALTVA
ncbi:MAG: metal ABC transporter permease, partial [Alphaproteobacteria bacterium]|nr:metal ABC transporter permease [Alphaproteobacteria bacterium]